MDPTISVSKGCFVFKNGATKADRSARKGKKKQANAQILDENVTKQGFYQVYTETWASFKADIENLQRESYTKTLWELVEYIRDVHKVEGVGGILPAAALLTGINQPDHQDQFETLSQRIHDSISANVCMVQSRDCPSIKAAIETMVYGFVEKPIEDDEDRDHKRLRKTQCTMQVLNAWYLDEYPMRDRTLVVVLPDFESFSADVLQDFILILNSHCARLPIVLVLGVATAVSALHSTLPYHVTSKIKLKIFQTQSAPLGLNEIVEKAILSPKYNFHLSGKSLKFLTHIFLYYDFSINGFIQGFKYCLMEHFFQGNGFSLCADYDASLKTVQNLSHDDLESIRRLPSYRPYVESKSPQTIIDLLTDDAYFKSTLPRRLMKCHLHFLLFRCSVEFLNVLVEDLPRCPLGKYRREVYSTCIAKDAVELPEFKECWQMLSFMSKDEFVGKFRAAIEATRAFVRNELGNDVLRITTRNIFETLMDELETKLTDVLSSGTEAVASSSKDSPPTDLKQLNRQELKEKLLEMSKQDRPVSQFAKSLADTLEFVRDKIISVCLRPLSRAPPLHELFFFTDIASVRRNIIGAPRAALHMALNNPQFYLQCACCDLNAAASLVPTLPDLSVAYKLHLECGRMINLFDWLQAFRSVVDFDEEEQEQIDPKIQARFTRAVAELQFLGYIKTSKRKTDHVTRLTW